MSKFVTLVLEPRFNDWYGEYANLPVFNAHGDVVGYTGGEVPETGNPCEFCVMDKEGFPVCHSASESIALRQQLNDVAESMGRILERCAKLRELLFDAYKAATDPDCDECPNEYSCKNNQLSHCVMWVDLQHRMEHDLGIEVDA